LDARGSLAIMSESELPENVQVLLRGAVPNVNALELLLFVASRPSQSWRVEEIGAAIWPVALAESAARQYLQHFRDCGLIAETADGRLQYHAASPELAAAVQALVRLYVEKPVSVMRAIYTPPDSKIQSFADAFRIRKDFA